MKEDKKIKKEQFIIESAERVFEKVGFKNAKMDDIAAAAGITKVTLYSYFQSKENLYLAITYNALSALNEVYLQTIKNNETNSGMVCTLALLETFMLCTLHGWTVVIGYVKILSASGDNATPLFKVNLKELKKVHLKMDEIMFGVVIL